MAVATDDMGLPAPARLVFGARNGGNNPACPCSAPPMTPDNFSAADLFDILSIPGGLLSFPDFWYAAT